MGRPFLANTPLPAWGTSGSVPDWFCRGFGVAFLTGGGRSRDLRFLFGGSEGSDETRLTGVDVLARLLFTSSKDGPETEDAGCSSTG